MTSHRLRTFGAAGLLALIVLLALGVSCGDSDNDDSDDDNGDESSSSTLPLEEQLMYCQDVSYVRSSLIDVQSAGQNQADLQSAAANVDAAAQKLNTWGKEFEGGDAAIADLDQDIQQLQAVVNDPALIAMEGEIAIKLDAISSDLDTLDEAGSCP